MPVGVLNTALGFSLLSSLAYAARQPYDVRKIIDAFRRGHDDLTILCAHRGQRWNGTAENSRDSYFRASQSGIECIETDIRVSLDGHILLVHDKTLGRTTDIGEYTGREAYNPYTGRGYNPELAALNYTELIEHLHLRDDGERVRQELVPTLPQIIESIRESGANVVLQLDFKDKAAVPITYHALKNLCNAAGVPANEWCIYKVQAKCGDSVYQPKDTWEWNTSRSIRAFQATNYTISAEIEMRSTKGPLQKELNIIKNSRQHTNTTSNFSSAGIFFAAGDLTTPISSFAEWWDTANYTLPEDERANNSVFVFEENRAPVLQDSLLQTDEEKEKESMDGHDHRTDFAWILERGYNWVITDTADLWHRRLESQGRRNISRLISDGEEVIKGDGYYM